MKKLLLLILIIGLVGWYVWSNNGKDKGQPVEIMTTVLNPDPANATFYFDDGPIKLKNGKVSLNITGSAISVDTNLAKEPVAYGDINGDGKNDAVIILSQDGGGSGIFVYLAAYVSGNVEYKGSNAVFIGDRISPESITVLKSGLVTFEYLDRDEKDPMTTEPTLLRKATFAWKNQALEEI